MTPLPHVLVTALALATVACGQVEPPPAAAAPSMAPTAMVQPSATASSIPQPSGNPPAPMSVLATLQVRMLGSIVRTDPAASTALVSVGGGAPVELKPGAELVPGVRVEVVSADALMLGDGVQRRRIALDPSEPPRQPGAAPVPGNAVAVTPGASQVRQPGDLEDVFQKALKEQLGGVR